MRGWVSAVWIIQGKRVKSLLNQWVCNRDLLALPLKKYNECLPCNCAKGAAGTRPAVYYSYSYCTEN